VQFRSVFANSVFSIDIRRIFQIQAGQLIASGKHVRIGFQRKTSRKIPSRLW
jgi:hypothetical protein